MIVGHVRDNLPRVLLALPGLQEVLHIELVVDTGFDGGLALPSIVLSQLAVVADMRRPVLMADGTRRTVFHYLLMVGWFDEERQVEVIELDGRPLLGGALLDGCQVSIEMRDGGEVIIEPL